MSARKVLSFVLFAVLIAAMPAASWAINGVQSIEVTGYGLLTVGNAPPRYVSYRVFALDCPGCGDFRLQLRDFAGNLIYDSASCPQMSTCVTGDVVVSPCAAPCGTRR